MPVLTTEELAAAGARGTYNACIDLWVQVRQRGRLRAGGTGKGQGQTREKVYGEGQQQLLSAHSGRPVHICRRRRSHQAATCVPGVCLAGFQCCTTCPACCVPMNCPHELPPSQSQSQSLLHRALHSPCR